MTLLAAPISSEEEAWKAQAKERRDALAAEWEARAPQSPAEVLAFYRDSEHLEADLDSFHAHPDRKKWTEILIHLAKNVAVHGDPPEEGATVAIDIGSGAGHDLLALRDTNTEVIIGVEPNTRLREGSRSAGFRMYADVDEAPIEDADLISCFDVLEHVVDPEQFLGEIAARMHIGSVIVETCATFDVTTPLHLKENRGWHPGHVLEQYGFQKIGEADRVRVWRRFTPEHHLTTGLIICAYRGVSTPTFQSILMLIDQKLDGPNPYGWRVSVSGEAGINRSRSIMASRWWRETADDVFLMIDDDIVFSPQDAEKLADRCRNGHDIICAAYPVRDGGHLAIRGFQDRLSFFDTAEPVEIRWPATGFIAVHRRVLDAMIPKLVLCHENQPWSFWPCFDFRIVEDVQSGGHNYLSEDWNFGEMARELGFKIWLDPSINLGHLAEVKLNLGNMAGIHKLLTGKESDVTERDEEDSDDGQDEG